MTLMPEDEIKPFLMAGTGTAKVATVRADGRPHVAPVWFVLDGDDVIFTTGETSVKARNLRRDPHVAICVNDDRPPYAYVLIEGTATLTPHGPELLKWATAIGGRYVGAGQAEAYGQRSAVPGELLVRVTPTKMHAEKNIAG